MRIAFQRAADWRTLPLALVLTCLFAASSQAVTIDFQGEDPFFGRETISEDGFTLTGLFAGFPFSNLNVGEYLGEKYLFPTTTSAATRLTQDNGQAFDVLSLQFGGLNGTITSTQQTFIGEKAGGGTVSVTFSASGNVVAGFETFLLPSSFVNLTALSWSFNDPTSTAKAFDNFVLEPVPEPSTGAMVGLGLVLFGTATRRRR